MPLAERFVCATHGIWRPDRGIVAQLAGAICAWRCEANQGRQTIDGRQIHERAAALWCPLSPAEFPPPRQTWCASTHWVLAFLRHRYTGKRRAGDEARTRDVHLGKVVLYQLSYTRSFERDNNVQPTAPRNLLIASECSKSLNPNRTFTASYDQTLYEKTIPPLHVLARVVWQLVSADSDRNSDCQPDSTDGSNSRDSGNLSSGASISGST